MMSSLRGVLPAYGQAEQRRWNVQTVNRLVVLQDVGKAINPMAVHGQLMGGATQGIGWALYEKDSLRRQRAVAYQLVDGLHRPIDHADCHQNRNTDCRSAIGEWAVRGARRWG